MKRKLISILMIAIMAALLISPALSADAFRDVSRTQWYYDAVNYVVENKYMNGIDAHTFAPEVPVTRGVLVTVLYRMDGTPSGYSRTSFSDVKRGSYYEAAVAWASANGIVTGYSSTKFGPNDPVTREQFAAILYRYAGYKGVDEPSNAKLSQYDDYPQISAYAIPAMRWANENGLLTGTSQTTLSPKGTTTRAQAAAIIMRYQQLQTDGPDEKDHEQREAAENDDPVKDPEQNDDPIKSPEQNTPASSGQPEIIVSSVTAKKGGQVTVDVNVENNPGILGMTLSVSYDSKVLTLTAAESGDALKDVLSFTPAKNLKSGCSFVWYGTTLRSQQIKDGCILRLTFKVNTAASGTYPIVITASTDDIIDADLNAVTAQITNGGITVK